MRQAEYLQILTEQIRSKKARSAVGEEIKGHIEEQKLEFMSEGMESQEAEEAAVREMGDPVAAGNELDRIHRPKMAWGMIGLIGLLSVAGLLIQYLLKLQMRDSTILVRGLRHNLFYMIVGMGVMMAVCYLDYSRIGYWARELMAFLAGLMILNIWYFGAMVNGRYYFAMPMLGGISYQNLFMLFVPLYAGVLYSFRGQGLRAVIKGLGIMLGILFEAAVISGITTAMILLPTFLIALSIAVYKGWFRISRKRTLTCLWSGAALLPFAVYFGVMLYGAEYQIVRFQTMLDPSRESGYQIRMVKDLVAGSRLVGGSPSVADSSLVLPNSGDYIITYAAAYYGILAAVFLTALIAFLFLRLLRVSLRQRNQLGMMMGVSCSVVFLVQLIVYMLANTGALPIGGTYCPFVTNGASGMLLTYFLLGLILSIYRYQNVVPQKSTAEGKKMVV